MDPPTGPAVFPDPYAEKRAVEGTVVAVLRGVTDRRGLRLADYRSRALPAGQIHELMTTDELISPNGIAERVALLAFFEVATGGVVLVGDVVEIDGRRVGTVAGFNDTHMPNHQNICLRADALVDGETLRLRIGASVRIAQNLVARRE
jgi:hypothetical protein